MNVSSPDRRRLGALILLLAGTAAGAAPRSVEAFDDAAWAALQAQVRRPTVVVFTATWCPNCPAVFDQMALAIARRKLDADLVGVVMDRAPGDDDAALLANAHLRKTHRLFAFEGQAPRLRHGVDPKWRGVTPYVAFVAPGKPVQTVVGAPSDADLTAWAKLAR